MENHKVTIHFAHIASVTSEDETTLFGAAAKAILRTMYLYLSEDEVFDEYGTIEWEKSDLSEKRLGVLLGRAAVAAIEKNKDLLDTMTKELNELAPTMSDKREGTDNNKDPRVPILSLQVSPTSPNSTDFIGGTARQEGVEIVFFYYYYDREDDDEEERPPEFGYYYTGIALDFGRFSSDDITETIDLESNDVIGFLWEVYYGVLDQLFPVTGDIVNRDAKAFQKLLEVTVEFE